MPSSPKTSSNYTMGLPSRYPAAGRRCHIQRRILFLFSVILIVSSGSMLVLHITSTPFLRSDSTSCQSPGASSSSSSSSSDDCPAITQTRWRTHQPQPDVPDKDTDPFKGSFIGHDRPRAALPHPVENNKELGDITDGELDDGSSGLDRGSGGFPPSLEQQQGLTETSSDPSKSPLSNTNNNDDDHNSSMDGEEEEGLEDSTPAVPFEETFDETDPTMYLTYLPYAGITNQFYGMLRGMELAKALDRTLILPPITASSHDKSKQNQPWSKFLDLKRVIEKTGVKIVEYHELRDVEVAELNEIKCGIVCGFGSKRTIDFTAKGFLKQWKLNVTLETLEQDPNRLETIVSILEPQAEDKYICVSNTYKIAVKGKSEWEHFGQHLYFTEELESFVQEFMEENLTGPSGELLTITKDGEEEQQGQEEEGEGSTFVTTSTVPQYHYLAIHVRRGDFAAYCEGNFQGPRLIHCLPTTEQIAERIAKVQERLNPTMDPSKFLPVFVATNERRPEELKKFADLGWRYLDHDQMGTAERLGVFGPMMVDQVFMAHAQALVGIQMSTFSRVGGLRQRDWHGREVEYM